MIWNTNSIPIFTYLIYIWIHTYIAHIDPVTINRIQCNRLKDAIYNDRGWWRRHYVCISQNVLCERFLLAFCLRAFHFFGRQNGQVAVLERTQNPALYAKISLTWVSVPIKIVYRFNILRTYIFMLLACDPHYIMANINDVSTSIWIYLYTFHILI